MIAAPQVAIQPEHQPRLHAGIVDSSTLYDVPRHLPRREIAFPAQTADASDVLLSRRRRNSFGEDSHHRMILFGALVAADDVVIEHRFQFPTLIFRHLCEMMAAVQPLLFPRDRQKNDGPGKLL